jgi:hypothetical protein
MPTSCRLLVLALAAVGSARAESALAFVDLRAQGGLAASDGNSASLSVMAGDIGNKDQHVISLDADMGIVIGLRASMMEVTGEREDGGADLDLTLGGGTFLGGFGFYLGKNTHAELLGAYSQGSGSTTGDVPWDDRDTRYKAYHAEFGWYYTWSTGIQLGLLGGYSIIKLKYDDPVLAARVKAEAKGFDASIALGYRF